MRLGRILNWSFLAGATFAAVALVILRIAFSPEQVYVRVENKTSQPVLIVDFAYRGQRFAYKRTLAPGQQSETFCTRRSYWKTYQIEFLRAGETASTRTEFPQPAWTRYQRITEILIQDEQVTVGDGGPAEYTGEPCLFFWRW